MTGFTTVLTYTEPMLRRAVRTYMVRRVLRGRLVVLGAAIVAIEALALLVLSARADFLLGILVATVLFLGGFVAAVWRAHAANTLGRFRAMPRPQATLTVTDEAFTVSSGLGAATIPWSGFTEVWVLPECWMLFLGPASFNTVPLAGLDAAQRAMLARKLPPPSH